ncbi:MAG: outer membrane lipoprotein-sorting protein [Gammaproteobacteria bacterium]
MMWSLALRNLYRDRRRTVTTILAVAVGLLAALLFLGYVRFVEAALARVVIYADANGHVQVYRKDGPQNLAADPARFSLAEADQQQVLKVAAALPGFKRASAQLVGVGVLQHGQRSAVFLARGVDPEFERSMQAEAPAAPLDDVQRQGIALTPQILDLLGARVGDSVQLVGASYANRANAVDATVQAQFSTGIEATEDKGLKAPLALLQSLYDTSAVSRMVIELDARSRTEAFQAALARELERAAPGYFEVTRWDHPQIGQLYTSFMGFFQLVFACTGALVLVIALATIQHAIAMNIHDRTREIGMLRALGFSRAAIGALLVRETLLACAAAALLALGAAYLLGWALAAAGVQTVLPRVATATPLRLDLPLGWAVAVLGLALAAIGAGAWLGARKRVGGAVRGAKAGRGARAVPLVQLLAGAACVLLVLRPLPASAADASNAAAPSQDTMLGWLKQADLARGGYGSYRWTLRIHTADPAGATDTAYAVTVKGGKALARTVEPKRYQGEKVLIAERSMWFIKPGLRKPVTISPQQRLVGEASNGDIAAVQYARQYTPSWLGETEVDGVPCYKLRLAAADASATYSSIIYYIDKKTLLGARAEFLTSSDTVFKSATFSYANRMRADGKDLPFISSMRIVNASFANRYSELVYSEPQRADTPDSSFVPDNLMTM